MPIELVTTDGIFALDGGEWEVTNNIWLVGDDREVVVFDAAHDHAADRRRDQRPPGAGDRADPRPQRPHQRRRAAARRRRRADPAARRRPHAVGRRVARRHARRRARARRVVHASAGTSSACCTRPATPRAAAASTTPPAGVVFTGDTLFCGGPGATGRSYSDEPTILRSIRDVAAGAARRDGRAHRPRRVDDDRRRAPRRHGQSRRARHLTRVECFTRTWVHRDTPQGLSHERGEGAERTSPRLLELIEDSTSH